MSSTHVRGRADEASLRQVPTALEPYLRAALPALQTLSSMLDQAWPYVVRAFAAGEALWKVVEPHQHSVLPAAFGLILLFLGGSLPLTLAAIEAFRLCGWWVGAS